MPENELPSIQNQYGFLHPVTPEEFLPPLSRWISFGGVLLFSLFASAVAAASIIKYQVTVKAPATIRPVGELRLVQTAIAGTIKTIKTKTNQQVKQGDIIAYLDDTRLQLDKLQRQNQIQFANLQLKQIQAQIQALEAEKSAEISQNQRYQTANQAQLKLSQRQYQDQKTISSAEVKEAESDLELAQDQLQRYQQLANTGAIAQLQLEEKKSALKTAQARLEKAKTALNPSPAEIEIAQAEIAQTEAKEKATLARFQQQQEALNQEKTNITNQIKNYNQELQQLDTEIKKTIIRAPITGIVTQLNLRNNSQFLQAGETIAQIAPSQDSLEIKASVASSDISKISLNQAVQIRVSACPYPDYGTLPGTIIAVSPDTINSKISTNSSYEVMIKPEKLQLNSGQKNCTIQAGMEGRADIITETETVWQFLHRKARFSTNF